MHRLYSDYAPPIKRREKGQALRICQPHKRLLRNNSPERHCPMSERQTDTAHTLAREETNSSNSSISGLGSSFGSISVSCLTVLR